MEWGHPLGSWPSNSKHPADFTQRPPLKDSKSSRMPSSMDMEPAANQKGMGGIRRLQRAQWSTNSGVDIGATDGSHMNRSGFAFGSYLTSPLSFIQMQEQMEKKDTFGFYDGNSRDAKSNPSKSRRAMGSLREQNDRKIDGATSERETVEAGNSASTRNQRTSKSDNRSASGLSTSRISNVRSSNSSMKELVIEDAAGDDNLSVSRRVRALAIRSPNSSSRCRSDEGTDFSMSPRSSKGSWNCVSSPSGKNAFRRSKSTIEEEDEKEAALNLIEEFPFSCPVCNRRFSAVEYLKYHVMSQECSEEDSAPMIYKRFSCEQCPKKYGYKYNLKRHVEAKHNVAKE
mmetsp:Transcript_2942/g.4327  ORF Transcript_2942/g.4327 Transcript_2942/m.4327 type:complete len:343 (-) Transcript_2942:199-1227(-)